VSDVAAPTPRSHRLALDDELAPTLLAAESVSKYFPLHAGVFGTASRFLRAVDGVSMRVRYGETFAIVGESGCGKSTLGRLLLRLADPTLGRIVFEGRDITHLSQRFLSPLRRRMQIIFQDPTSSLDPRVTAGDAVGEAIHVHKLARGRVEERDRVAHWFGSVGLRLDVMDRYPHELSAGQRQRVAIARALAVEPRFLVCDEPTASLDVSTQAQIVNLLVELQEARGIAYLFVSHDLSLVQHIGHRVAVMYLGRIVEQGAAGDLCETPRHPYTKALLAAAPQLDPGRVRSRIPIAGDAPSPITPPSGCAFHPRCPRAARGICDRDCPLPEETPRGSGHKVACWFPEQG
jgi:oligopeptide transport system ATP-binding protein